MNLKPKRIFVGNFRKMKSLDFTLGDNITIISGHNGVGKSNLLSLIASGSGVNIKSNFGSNFQPDFMDYFYIYPGEPLSEYKILVEYYDNSHKESFYKKLSFKDDTNTNRGIRVIPRTAKNLNEINKDGHSRTLKDETERVKDLFGSGGAARVKIPTIYLSLSRLYPIGENKELVDIKEISNRSKLKDEKTVEKFYNWYNSVIYGVLDKNFSGSKIIYKPTTSRKSMFLNMGETHALSQSVGQDSLGNIISALVDIYLLSTEPGYVGAILCIDEVDVSLHPDAQLRLFKLLKRLSNEYHFQVIVTTHSLTLIKEILKLKKKNDHKYELIYLVDPKLPSVVKVPNYNFVKSQMFNNISTKIIKNKIYFEDEVGHGLFLEYIKTFKKLTKHLKCITFEKIHHTLISDIQSYDDNLLDLDAYSTYIPVYIGCETLFKLVENDEHFRQVLIVLDGDARINEKGKSNKPIIKDYLYERFEGTNKTRKHPDNICFLPGFFAPESYIYKIVNNLIENREDYFKFWNSLSDSEETMLYNSSNIEEKFITDSVTNDLIKKNSWDTLWKFVTTSNALYFYFLQPSNYQELIDFLTFINDFHRKNKICRMKLLAKEF